MNKAAELLTIVDKLVQEAQVRLETNPVAHATLLLPGPPPATDNGFEVVPFTVPYTGTITYGLSFSTLTLSESTKQLSVEQFWQHLGALARMTSPVGLVLAQVHAGKLIVVAELAASYRLFTADATKPSWECREVSSSEIPHRFVLANTSN